jgi:hypothetical protein
MKSNSIKISPDATHLLKIDRKIVGYILDGTYYYPKSEAVLTLEEIMKFRPEEIKIRDCNE